MTTPSLLWSELSKTLFANIDESFLAGFRAPGGANRRLAAWDPLDRSLRYYKMLLITNARSQPREFISAYKKLRGTTKGNPVTVTVAGCEIDIDYLFAVDEYLFLKKHLDLRGVKRIVEIGAGFGRTCHTLMTLLPRVERYTIIDLPAVLNLSRRYLSTAAPRQAGKVNFIDCTTSEWRGIKSDLAINIDSFQEMLPPVIDSYMRDAVSGAGAFYCKNPTGKYRPESVGLPPLAPGQLLDVFALGYCRGMMDIFDERDLESARKKYLSAYLPPGPWKLKGDSFVSIFPHVHHALYVRRNTKRKSP